jgi:hypothetical protein
MFVMLSIQCHSQPFFRSYNLCLVLWIDFSHLFNDIMHAHPHCIFFEAFWNGDFIVILLKSGTWHGEPIEGALSVLAHLCIFHLITIIHLVFSFVGKWYTYSRYCIRCGSYFFMIVIGFFNIRAFSAANEICNLVSIGVEPLFITSSWLSYSRFRFSYFGCIDGIQIIHWIVCD